MQFDVRKKQPEKYPALPKGVKRAKTQDSSPKKRRKVRSAFKERQHTQFGRNQRERSQPSLT